MSTPYATTANSHRSFFTLADSSASPTRQGSRDNSCWGRNWHKIMMGAMASLVSGTVLAIIGGSLAPQTVMMLMMPNALPVKPSFSLA